VSAHPAPAWLLDRGPAGVRWGLERIGAVLSELGNPHLRFPSLHIAGTNGKGSVAALCASALQVRGSTSVGLYTSPHLIDFRERIRIDGASVGEDLVSRAAERVRPLSEKHGLTGFESMTAVGFLCFAEAGVEVAVVEVGLGGRLDATNVITPLASAVTNVSLEHTELLGADVATIAAEKAGIFKSGVPALSAAGDAEVDEVLARTAAAAGAPFRRLGELCRVRSVDGDDLDIDSLTWGRQTIRSGLPGRHQHANTLLAAELLGLLPAELRPRWSDIERGFAEVRWPGRCQRIVMGSTTWILDVAHNPAGAAVLAEHLEREEPPRPLVLVLGIAADKRWEEMAAPLLPHAEAVLLAVPPSMPPARAWDPGVVAERLTALGARARAMASLDAALSRASTLAPHGTVVVTGSAHTVGDALRHLGAPA